MGDHCPHHSRWQAEDLKVSVISLMNLVLTVVPYNTTVSRRAAALPLLPHISAENKVHLLIDSTGMKVYGAGKWLEGHAQCD